MGTWGGDSMIDISVFGPTTVRLGGSDAATEPAGVKPKRILEILAVELGSPVSKDVLAERLWDGHPPASFLGSLESYVCVLRRWLAAGGGHGSPLVTTHRGYLLDPTRVHVDLADVRARLESLTHTGGRRLVTGAEQALERVTGDLLADEPYAAWAEQSRDELAELLEGTCARAAEVAAATGEAARGVRLARAAVHHGGLSEPAHRALMAAYRASGNRPQALMVYADLRARMIEEVGVEPSAATQALYLDLLDDEHPHRPAADRREMHALVRLLRQVLDAGVRPDTDTRAGLAEVAALVAGPSL